MNLMIPYGVYTMNGASLLESNITLWCLIMDAILTMLAIWILYLLIHTSPNLGSLAFCLVMLWPESI